MLASFYLSESTYYSYGQLLIAQYLFPSHAIAFFCKVTKPTVSGNLITILRLYYESIASFETKIAVNMSTESVCGDGLR